MKADNLIE